MSRLYRNPLTDWLGKLAVSVYLEHKNKGKSLKIGYLSYAKNTEFGIYNTVYTSVHLLDSRLGDFTYIADRTRIQNATIGRFCSIGPDCKIGLGQHPTSTFVSTHPIFFSTGKQAQISFPDKDYFPEKSEIVIENDVWLGANVIIVDGVTISNGAIVAAGSVVTKNVPPYAVVGGVPARILKYRFGQGEIDTLLKSKWWDRSVQSLRIDHKLFHDIKNAEHL